MNNKLYTFGTHAYGINQIYKLVTILAYTNKTGQLKVFLTVFQYRNHCKNYDYKFNQHSNMYFVQHLYSFYLNMSRCV